MPFLLAKILWTVGMLALNFFSLIFFAVIVLLSLESPLRIMLYC